MGTKQRIKLDRFKWQNIIIALHIAEQNCVSTPFKQMYARLREEIKLKWKPPKKKKELLGSDGGEK